MLEWDTELLFLGYGSWTASYDHDLPKGLIQIRTPQTDVYDTEAFVGALGHQCIPFGQKSLDLESEFSSLQIVIKVFPITKNSIVLHIDSSRGFLAY